MSKHVFTPCAECARRMGDFMSNNLNLSISPPPLCGSCRMNEQAITEMEKAIKHMSDEREIQRAGIERDIAVLNRFAGEEPRAAGNKLRVSSDGGALIIEVA